MINIGRCISRDCVTVARSLNRLNRRSGSDEFVPVQVVERLAIFVFVDGNFLVSVLWHIDCWQSLLSVSN